MYEVHIMTDPLPVPEESPPGVESHPGAGQLAPSVAPCPRPPQSVGHKAVLQAQAVHLDHGPAPLMVSIVPVVTRAPPSQAQAAQLVRGGEGQLIEAEAEGQRAPGYWFTLPHVKGVESRHLTMFY